MFDNIAPSLEARAQKARSYRKAPGASGRLHRTEAGDWVWSSDSEEEAQSDESDEENPLEKPPNPLIHKGLHFPKILVVWLLVSYVRLYYFCIYAFQKGCLNSQVIIELPIRIFPAVARAAAQVPPVNTMKLVPPLPYPLPQQQR